MRSNREKRSKAEVQVQNRDSETSVQIAGIYQGLSSFCSPLSRQTPHIQRLRDSASPRCRGLRLQIHAGVSGYSLHEGRALAATERREHSIGLPSAQFPQLATRLVYGHLQEHFAGAAHCRGCRPIKAAADGADRYGSAGAWRKLGTIHHLTAVMHGLRNVAWP